MNSNGDIHKRLLEVQKLIGVVKKDGKNKEQGYAFQQWEDIALEIRQALNESGVTIDSEISGPPIREVYQSNSGKRVVSTLVPIKITFFSEDGSSTSASWYGESADYADKSLGKAVTSGVKGYLLKRFLVPIKPPEGESDHESPEGKTGMKPQSNSPEPEKPASKPEPRPEPQRAQEPPKAGSVSLAEGEIIGKGHPFWRMSRTQKDQCLGPELDVAKKDGEWVVVRREAA